MIGLWVLWVDHDLGRNGLVLFGSKLFLFFLFVFLLVLIVLLIVCSRSDEFAFCNICSVLTWCNSYYEF